MIIAKENILLGETNTRKLLVFSVSKFRNKDTQKTSTTASIKIGKNKQMVLLETQTQEYCEFFFYSEDWAH
jgi:hypothetical protein